MANAEGNPSKVWCI